MLDSVWWYVLDNLVGLLIALFTAIGAIAVLAHYHGGWLRGLFARAWYLTTLPFRLVITGIVFKLKQWRANIYIRICRVGLQREREQLMHHFMEMLHDSENQMLGSWLVGENGVTLLDGEKCRRLEKAMVSVRTSGMGRSEALKDVISHLVPELYPPENWDGWSTVHGDGIFWREQESGNDNMVLLERVDKKYGRAHKLFYRRDAL